MRAQCLLYFCGVMLFGKGFCDNLSNVVALVVIEMHCAATTENFKVGFKTKGFFMHKLRFSEAKNNDLIMLF